MKEDIGVLVDKDALKDLIWMSCRYCIGRKTIAAVTHPNTIIELSRSFDSNFKSFLSRGIRMILNDCAGFTKNIVVEGFTDNYSAYDILYKYLYENPHINPELISFKINVNTGKIQIGEPTSEYYDIRNDFDDVIIWIRLCDYLEGNFKTVVYKCNDTIKEIKCIETLSYNEGRFYKQYIPIDNNFNPLRENYLLIDNIVEIK